MIDIAGGDLNRANRQRLFTNAYGDLAPDTPLGVPALAGISLAFGVCIDPRPVTLSQVYVQRLLKAAEGAEIWHVPAQTYPPQQALDEACRLPKRHTKQPLQCQECLDRGAIESLPPTAIARQRCC